MVVCNARLSVETQRLLVNSRFMHSYPCTLVTPHREIRKTFSTYVHDVHLKRMNQHFLNYIIYLVMLILRGHVFQVSSLRLFAVGGGGGGGLVTDENPESVNDIVTQQGENDLELT